jgi:hypothetical protein
MGCLVRRYREWFQASHAEGRPPTNERVMQNADGGRVSHVPFVAVNWLRSIHETTLREEGPFFPTGAAPVDSGRVDTNLVFEERGGIWEIEESE